MISKENLELAGKVYDNLFINNAPQILAMKEDKEQEDFMINIIAKALQAKDDAHG